LVLGGLVQLLVVEELVDLAVAKLIAEFVQLVKLMVADTAEELLLLVEPVADSA